MEFYPPKFWGLDPLFSAKAKFNISELLTLKDYPEFPGVYCVLNHPIISVHAVGDVVSIHRRQKLINYEVDDGSGVIGCVQWRKVEDSDKGLVIPRLGSLVSVYGRLSEYRNERQIKIAALVVETDPNVEPLHWLQTTHLRKNVYSKPFHLPPGISFTRIQQEEDKKSSRLMLMDLIVQHLSKRPQPFTFTLGELLRDESLKKYLMEQLQLSEVTVSNFDEAFGRVVISLPREGHAVPVQVAASSYHAAAQETRYYEVLTNERHLFPLILKYIRQKSSQCKQGTGVPERWIIEYVKSKSTYSELPTLRIARAIEALETASEIYQASPRTYDCVP